MEFSLGSLSKEIRRAWMHAFFTALNRDAKEITIEDALVGLHRVFGMLMLQYFESPSSALALIERVEKSAHVHDFSFSKPFEPGEERRGGQGETCYSARTAGRSVAVSAGLRNVLAAADAGAKSNGHPWVGLSDVMHALARNSEARMLFQESGIGFQGDLKTADAEATTHDNAGTLSVEELLKLCEHWKKTSTRVMCDFFSGSGTIQTSLGALFHVIGKIGHADLSHAQIRVDAEGAVETSCLVDLRGSSVKRETLDQFPHDARIEPSPLIRIEIRLATGDRCTISSMPMFAYGAERGPAGQ